MELARIFFSLQMVIGKPIPVGEDNLTSTLLKTMKVTTVGIMTTEA